MSAIENLLDWKGKDVNDSAGEKIGRLVDAYYDAETDLAQFLVIEVGALRKHSVLVPAGGITASPDHLTLPIAKDATKDAPTVDTGELSAEDEQRAFEHYGFQYAPASTASGRRLVRH
jgi:hypothetical protein